MKICTRVAPDHAAHSAHCLRCGHLWSGHPQPGTAGECTACAMQELLAELGKQHPPGTRFGQQP